MLLCALLASSGVSPRAVAQSAPRTATPAAADVIAQSIALEAQGNLTRARQLMIDAFGELPASYEPCVRLAALALQMRRSSEAVLLYRVARGLPNSQPEAALGLGLALTMHGYERMAAGAYGDARSALVEAMLIDDSNTEARKGVTLLGGPRGTGVDLLASQLRENAGATRAQLYALHVPVRVDERLALRFAARHLTGAGFGALTTAFVSQTHFYAGLVRDVGRSTVEVMAFMVSGSAPTSLGAAATVRHGGAVGVQGQVASVGLPSGTNIQLVPAVYWRPSMRVNLTAGARITRDPAGTLTSPTASLAVRSDRVSLDVLAHLGDERWAYSSTGPSMQPWLGTAERGISAGVAVRVTRVASVLVQAQAEQSSSIGAFRHLGIGLRIAAR
jgi:hypothetical protein